MQNVIIGHSPAAKIVRNIVWKGRFVAEQGVKGVLPPFIARDAVAHVLAMATAVQKNSHHLVNGPTSTIVA
jgi:hypothetical protein